MFIPDCKYKWETLRLAATAEAAAITAFYAPDDWPSTNTINLNQLFPFANSVKIMWYGSDAADEDCLYRIYGRRQQNGPIELLLAGEVTLGARICAKDPVTGDALTNHKWCDTATVTTGTMDEHDVIQNTGANDEICAIIFPLQGITEMFMEIDIDGGDGNACATMGAIITGVSLLGA